MTAPEGQINIGEEFSEKLTIHKNMDQAVILITADKVRLCLLKNRDALTQKNEWLMPLSLLVTIAATLAATEFKKFIVEPAVWQALFILAGVACAVWLFCSVVRAWKNRKAGDIEDIVRELMLQQRIE